jgi:ABC-type phosphate transport system substrate-binding protein
MKNFAPMILLFFLALPTGSASGADGFILVINATNPTTEMEKKSIAKMFLKKAKRWEDGEAVVAIDQEDKSTVRERFTRDIHKKSTSAIKSYWQRMIFSGRDVPPLDVSSDAAVLDFVRKERGAIGYVSSGTELGSGVKELVAIE